MSGASNARGGKPAGFFDPESPIRRVHREGVLLLGGGRALLLQVAHPLVAAGVAEHSNFRSDPFGRLRRTLDAMLAIVFAEREVALAWVNRVRGTHNSVKGRLQERAGPFPPGTLYDANDPDLLLWVHATLVDTALFLYQAFFGRLDSKDLTSYYKDSRVIASLLGVPESKIPPTHQDFEAYMGGMLESDTLTVTETARELAAAVLRAPVPFLGRALDGPATFLTAAMLPGRLREGYRLGWGSAREMMWRGLLRTGRIVLPPSPRFLREMPQARRPPVVPEQRREHPR